MAVSWDVIRTERRALIDYLETLSPQQWATPGEGISRLGAAA